MFSSLSMNKLWGTEGLYEGTIFAPEGAPGSVLRSRRAIINTMAPRRRLTVPLALDTSLFKLQGCCTEKVFTQGQNTDKYSSLFFWEAVEHNFFFCWVCWLNGEGNSLAFLASVPARVPSLKVADKRCSDPRSHAYTAHKHRARLLAMRSAMVLRHISHKNTQYTLKGRNGIMLFLACNNTYRCRINVISVTEEREREIHRCYIVGFTHHRTSLHEN